MIISELFEAPQLCPECGGISFSDLILAEKKDACYHKVKASAKVWPSAYASGRLVQCRKKGAANYGNKSESVEEGLDPEKNQRLKDLIDQYRDATDPEASYELDAEEVIAQIRQEFGDRTADSVEQGPSMHYPRPGHSMGHDPMQYKSSPRINKSGILNKQDVGSMKRDIKQRLKPGVAEEYELAGVDVAYDLGRRAYQERKTIKDNPYSATKQARKYDEWEKGLERGKHDANDARLFRSSVREQGVAEGVMHGAEELNVGDPVVITGNVEFEGKTGEIAEFGRDKRFVVVDLYNHGEHSFHSSDVSFNDYAGSDDEEARMHDAGEFGDDPRDNMDEAKKQPPEVNYDDEYDAMVARVRKLAGIGPMKTTYDPARRVYKNVPTAQQPKVQPKK